MAEPSQVGEVDQVRRWKVWLDRPLSGWSCALGWLASTALFIAMVQLFGGPTAGDSYLSIGSTLAIAHGDLACAFPRSAESIAPLYPMLSGGIVAAAHIGHSVAFPAAPALGPSCNKLLAASQEWSIRAHALSSVLRVGYLGWLGMMTGIVSFLRASGRGRSGWEPATLVVVACLPPVWLCVESYFHPQDLLAMGLALASMACVRRDAWIAAGILIALAILSQQFAVLVAVPLLVLTPPNRRVHFALAALATCVAVTLPFLITSTRAAAHDVLLGTGDDLSSANTLLGELRLPNSAIFIVSRLTPLVLSLLLALWVVRRLGRPAAREPLVLACLVALSLSLRLVFEWSLYGYYFMGLAVVLVLLDVVRGHIRAPLVIWLIVLSLAYVVGSSASTAVLWRVPWRHSLERWLPLAALVLAVLLVASTIVRRGLQPRLLVWTLLVAGVVLTWPSSNDPLSAHVTTMELQVLLVLPGIALAALPLRGLIRQSEGTAPPNLRADVSAAQAR